jgi:hypothetical protein
VKQEAVMVTMAAIVVAIVPSLSAMGSREGVFRGYENARITYQMDAQNAASLYAPKERENVLHALQASPADVFHDVIPVRGDEDSGAVQGYTALAGYKNVAESARFAHAIDYVGTNNGDVVVVDGRDSGAVHLCSVVTQTIKCSLLARVGELSAAALLTADSVVLPDPLHSRLVVVSRRNGTVSATRMKLLGLPIAYGLYRNRLRIAWRELVVKRGRGNLRRSLIITEERGGKDRFVARLVLDDEESLASYRPLDAGVQAAWASDGTVWVGDGQSGVIGHFGPAGELLARHRIAAESFLTVFDAEYLVRMSSRTIPVTARERAIKEMGELGYPERYAAFVDLLVAEGGGVWLQRMAHAKEVRADTLLLPSMDDLGARRWLRIDTSGHTVDSFMVQVPCRLRAVAGRTAFLSCRTSGGGSVVRASPMNGTVR